MKKIPYVESGDTANHPLNKEWINQLVWAANAFMNMKIRIGNREFVPMITENGAYFNLSGNFGSGSNITNIISSSMSGSISASYVYDRSDVWQ